MKNPKLIAWFIALLFPMNVLSAEQEITVMSFNAWHDWTKIENGFDKAEAAIRKSGASLIGLQESSPATAARMAGKLGWHHAAAGTGSVQIISRYPIIEELTSTKVGNKTFLGARVRISENPSREVVLFNVHLDYVNYGPYAALKPGATPALVLEENARSKRVEQITSALAEMKSWLENSDSIPVFLTGDFNVPSHLDWTEENAAAHGNIGPVSWPESLQVAKAGFVDSYRSVHADPKAEPGTTWSSIHKAPEPQDRIDFTYHHGKGLTVRTSTVFTTSVETTLGAWGSDTTPVAKNTWPSDHAAVVTTYLLK